MPTINDIAILRCRIEEPRVGIWTADIEADTADDITGAVTIDIDGETFAGSVFRGGIESGRWHGRVVGGAGGMASRLPAKFYRVALSRRALDDLMTAAGETLDTTNSLAASLTYTLQRWHRRQGTAYSALTMMADELGVDVRVQRDGSWLLANATFPELESEHTQIDARPAAGMRTIAPAGPPAVGPGVTFSGERIDYVTTIVTGSTIRQELWSARVA